MTIKLKAEQVGQLWQETNPAIRLNRRQVEQVEQLWQEPNPEKRLHSLQQLSQEINPEKKLDCPIELVQPCPPQLGWGERTWTYLHHRGWLLLIHNYQLREDLEIFWDSGNGYPICELGFQISGEILYSEGYMRQTGDHFFAVDTPLVGAGNAIQSHKRRILQVDIHFNNFETIVPILQEQIDDFPPLVREMIEEIADSPANPNHLFSLFDRYKNKVKCYNFGIGKISVAMQNVLQQLLGCPYHGGLKTMYLESKILELFTLYLAQLRENCAIIFDCDRIDSHPKLQTDDIDRIYHARDILRDCLDNPPSLLGLARQVGLNDYKLKLGFRYVFGTTTFGYLYQHRMERAGQMLQEKQLSVGQVARAVGYASRSSFVKAFQKKFGV
ncbi:MAG: AraC family transcriptional regulator, partial [Cyanobacteria bacterium P01_E01_bin.42]